MKRINLNSPLLPYAQGAACLLAGIASALCFVVSQEGYVGMSAQPAAATSYLWSALAVCFGLLLYHVFVQKKIRLHWLTVLFALLFGVANTFGGLLFAYDQWDMLQSPWVLALTLVRSLGQAVPMAAALSWLEHVLRSGALMGKPQPRKGGVLRLMLLFVLCWSPYLIAFYPGTVCWDLGEMVAQFFGQTEMDTWHPVFTTWVMGGCVWFGRLFGSDNLGAALFTALQTVALGYALAQAVCALRRMGARRWLCLAATVDFAMVPLWGGYAQFISKDTLYTACLLLFVLAALRAVRGEKAAGGLFVWGLLVCLLRSNGLYVVLPSALVLAFAARARRQVIPALAGAVAGAMLFANVLIPALGIRDETASGLYSVCFQQTARVLRDHGESVTPEEYAQIDAVLDARRLPQLYEPWISDPVKYTFRQYGQGAQAEKEALARYRKTWLAMMARYPLDYAESFFAGNIGYYTFTPKMEGETYNNQAGNRLVFETYELGDSRGPDPRFLDTTQIAALQPLRRGLALFARGWRHIPLLGLLYVCATYTWLLVGAAISVCRQRRWRTLAIFAPALLSLGVCMLSPVNDYFRYFLPIVAMTLPLLGAAGCPEKAR